MPRVLIGKIAAPRIVIGKLANPCLDYVDYMVARHPGELATKDVADMRLTYAHPDADVAMECLNELRVRQRADIRASR